MSFLDVNIIREKDKFTTSVYRKPTLSEIYTYFDSFLPSSNKIGFLHTLLYRCFRIYSGWTKFHIELVKLIEVFKNDDYPGNFVNNCFKVFLDNKYRVREKVTTVPKKTLFLIFLYLGPLALQTTIVDKIFEKNTFSNSLPFPQFNVAPRNENLQG